MKLDDLLKQSLNEMAIPMKDRKEIIGKMKELVKAGNFKEAANIFYSAGGSSFTAEYKEVFTGDELAKIKENKPASEKNPESPPAAKRGPGAKAAEKKIENAEKSGITSTQSQSVIKNNILKSMIKADKEVQSDTSLSDDEKEASRAALQVMQHALEFSMAKGSGILNLNSIGKLKSSYQDKIKSEFLKKNAPAVFEKVQKMIADNKEEIEEYKEAMKAYMEQTKKETGKARTPAQDILAAERSGALKRIPKLTRTNDAEDEELERSMGTDKESLKAWREKNKRDSLSKDSLSRSREPKAQETKKSAFDSAKFEVERLKTALETSKESGKTGKIISDLEKKIKTAEEKLKSASSARIKEKWDSMK